MMSKKNRLAALLSLSAGMFLAACDNGASSGSGVDKTQVQADLQLLASKVTSFVAPMPGAGNSGLAKKSSSPLDTFTLPDCVNGLSVNAYTDTISGEVETSIDSTWNYAAGGALTCGLMAPRTVSHSYFRNPKYESWGNFSVVLSGSFLDSTLNFNASGSGRVHYFSGYDFTIDTLSMISQGGTVSTYVLKLALQDGKYTVNLSPSAGVDLSNPPQDLRAVVLRGAILLNKDTVGFFEVLGDDTIIIRDAANAIVETH